MNQITNISQIFQSQSFIESECPRKVSSNFSHDVDCISNQLRTFCMRNKIQLKSIFLPNKILFNHVTDSETLHLVKSLNH